MPPKAKAPVPEPAVEEKVEEVKEVPKPVEEILAPWRDLTNKEQEIMGQLNDEGVKKQIENTFKKYATSASGRMLFGSVKDALQRLQINLEKSQYEKNIASSWVLANNGNLNLQQFTYLVSTVYKPANLYGSALRNAASRGEVDNVEDLVRRGCNPNGRDGNGWATLHFAAAFGHTNVVNLLYRLTHDTLDVDIQDNEGWTPLLVAATRGNVDVFNALKSCGSSLSVTTKQGRTLLHWVATKGKTKMVQLLLSDGADPNKLDVAGWSPLHLATLHKHEECIKLLIAAGANLGQNDLMGRSPYSIAQGSIKEIYEAAKNKKK